jgi:hypothetical protein
VTRSLPSGAWEHKMGGFCPVLNKGKSGHWLWRVSRTRFLLRITNVGAQGEPLHVQLTCQWFGVVVAAIAKWSSGRTLGVHRGGLPLWCPAAPRSWASGTFQPGFGSRVLWSEGVVVIARWTIGKCVILGVTPLPGVLDREDRDCTRRRYGVVLKVRALGVRSADHGGYPLGAQADNGVGLLELPRDRRQMSRGPHAPWCESVPIPEGWSRDALISLGFACPGWYVAVWGGPIAPPWAVPCVPPGELPASAILKGLSLHGGAPASPAG